MEKSEHKSRTLAYFRQAAQEKQGFYDATVASKLGHSIWQKRVRNLIWKTFRELQDTHTSVIDVGCGNGDFIAEFAKEYPNKLFRGHDFSPEMIELAVEQRSNLDNLSFNVDDLLDDTSQRKLYDLVICLNVFHHLHVEDIDRGMAALIEMANKTVLFEIKNANNYWNQHFRPREDFPFTLLSPDRVKTFFQSAGFKLVKQWNIFVLSPLSPIVVLQLSRRD